MLQAIPAEECSRSRSTLIIISDANPHTFIMHGSIGDHGALLHDAWACSVSLSRMTISWQLLTDPLAQLKVARAGHLLKPVQPGLLMVTSSLQQLAREEDQLSWGMHFQISEGGGSSHHLSPLPPGLQASRGAFWIGRMHKM